MTSDSGAPASPSGHPSFALPTARRVKAAIARCSAKRTFERDGDVWYSFDQRRSGQGAYSEAEGLAQHRRLIGFDVLRSLGFDDDETHDFDWHLWPTDSVAAFVAKGIEEWRVLLEARAARLPFDTLVRAVIAAGRRA